MGSFRVGLGFWFCLLRSAQSRKNGPTKKKRGWGGAAQPPPLQTQTQMVSPPCEPLVEVQEPPGRNKQRRIRGRRGTGPGTRPAFFRVRSGLGWDLASSCKVSAKPKNGPTKKKRGWGGAAQPPPLRIQIRMLVEKACGDTQGNVGGGDAEVLLQEKHKQRWSHPLVSLWWRSRSRLAGTSNDGSGVDGERVLEHGRHSFGFVQGWVGIWRRPVRSAQSRKTAPQRRRGVGEAQPNPHP